MALYNLALLLALALASPWWLWQTATTRKYREGLLERLGWLGRVRQLPTAARPVVWLHAVSVGEVLAIGRLVTLLRLELPGHFIAVSTTTRTGQALARQRFGADSVFYCPLDVPWAVNARLTSLQPDLLVLAETEFWPNLLAACQRRQVPVMVVNARISDRSWPRYLRLRRLWKPFLSTLTRVLAQTELDATRLTQIGCVPGRVSVSGNLKFDVRVTADSEAVSLLRPLLGSLRLLVAGSTLDDEEAILIAAWPAILAPFPDTAMILAPRHPERFLAVQHLLEFSGLRWRSRSAITPTAAPLAPGEIFLLDTIGELASLYSLATIAFVGGSLVPAGGHNPLEPAQFAVPIVMGDSCHNFRDIINGLIAENAMLQVTPANFSSAIASLLADPAAASAMGLRAQAVFERESGATARTLTAILSVLAERQPLRLEDHQ